MKTETYRMKLSLWLLIAGLVFSGGLLGMNMMGVSKVKAVETNEVKEEIKMDPEKMMGEEGEIKSEAIDYYLPYPGLLPDHPFYWLKMVRDRMQLWLTTKSLAKAEKLLLFADKRLGAGWALVEGNKQSLGVTTLTKAEKYLERAIDMSQKLGEKSDEQQFKSKLKKAVIKHKEVLTLLIDKVSDEEKNVLKQIMGEEGSGEVKQEEEMTESEIESAVEKKSETAVVGETEDELKATDDQVDSVSKE